MREQESGLQLVHLRTQCAQVQELLAGSIGPMESGNRSWREQRAFRQHVYLDLIDTSMACARADSVWRRRSMGCGGNSTKMNSVDSSNRPFKMLLACTSADAGCAFSPLPMESRDSRGFGATGRRETNHIKASEARPRRAWQGNTIELQVAPKG